MTHNILGLLLMAGTSDTEGGESNVLMQLLPFLLIMVVFYFFMIRPQQRKAKIQRQFKDTIGKGDKIVTIGGLHGKIVEVRDTTFIIDAGNNNRLTIEKSALSMDLTRAVQGVGTGSAKAEATAELAEKQ